MQKKMVFAKKSCYDFIESPFMHNEISILSAAISAKHELQKTLLLSTSCKIIEDFNNIILR